MAIERADKHLSRWFGELLPCALAFETVPKVAYYLAGALLEVIDTPEGSTVPLPEVDAADEDIELWGAPWKMTDLIEVMTQVVRAEGGKEILDQMIHKHNL